MARFERTTRLDPPKVVSLCTIHPNSDHYCTPTPDMKMSLVQMMLVKQLKQHLIYAVLAVRK